MHPIKRLLLTIVLSSTSAAQAGTLELQQLGLRTTTTLVLVHGERNGSTSLNDVYRLRDQLEASWNERRNAASIDERQAMRALQSTMDTAIIQLQDDGFIELDHAEQMNRQLRLMQCFWYQPQSDEKGLLQLALLDLNYRYLHRSYIGMPETLSLPASGYYNAQNLELISFLDRAVSRPDRPNHSNARWQMLKRMYSDLDSSWAQTPTAPMVVNLNASQLLRELSAHTPSRLPNSL